MSRLRVVAGGVALTLLSVLVAVLGPGVVPPGSAASMVPSAAPPQTAVSPATRATATRLTPRERRLAKAKACSKRQWRKTPGRCQRIKDAKAKARSLKRTRTTPVVTPPGSAPVSPPAASPDAFTVSVLPDTQNEVFGADTRMRQRSQWLVSQRRQLNLRFVDHVGDVVNWGWLDRRQYDIASDAMRPLEQAGIPYSLSIGNHDTGAVGWNGAGGYGGDAYVKNPECARRLGAQCRTDLLVRRTQEFNTTFTARRFGAVAGAFEPGKVDNVYSTFSAGGRQWLVLNLEIWPRTRVVDWARGVVASHPRHNVIVSTHSYLDGDRANVYGGRDYGANSPRYLWDRLVSQYPNVKLVLSGHVGSGAMRTDTGVRGNKVISLLQTFHSAAGNPVRLVRIDPRNGSLYTWVTSPNGRGGNFGGHARAVSGMQFVG